MVCVISSESDKVGEFVCSRVGVFVSGDDRVRVRGGWIDAVAVLDFVGEMEGVTVGGNVRLKDRVGGGSDCVEVCSLLSDSVPTVPVTASDMVAVISSVPVEVLV